MFAIADLFSLTIESVLLNWQNLSLRAHRQREIVQRILMSNDDLISTTLKLHNVIYIFQCSINLVSLDVLNQHDIFYDNLNWILFLKFSKTTIEYVSRVNNNFMLQIKNSSDVEILLNIISKNVYQERDIAIHFTLIKSKLII